MPEHDTVARSTAELVARRSYGKLVAFLATRSNDVASAEDALSEAFTAALADWPHHGCPANPEAWLLTVARRKLIDRSRRDHSSDLVDQDLDTIAALNERGDPADIPDRRLALMFACAHPAIEVGIRAPLILQLILGLDAATIASAFLVSPATMGKRLVRAKSKIREAAIPLRIPERAELPGRLDAVLEAIYAAFSEGWSDAVGTDTARHDLTGEAFFLARLVSELLPQEPEALGLLALMLHSEARRPARRSETGEYIPLAAQDPACWDAQMIEEAEALLLHARARGLVGRYQLEAAVQSAHVHRCRTGDANWDAILSLYDGLMTVTGSPVVAINRALAVAEVHGAQAGLAAMPDPAGDGRLLAYQPYWAARAELLGKTGACGEARRAYEIALGLTVDPAVWRFLEQRRSALEDSCTGSR
jgi:RNA polymerase sigma-70 factor (ECF subfamily)